MLPSTILQKRQLIARTVYRIAGAEKNDEDTATIMVR
jgi:hypothetical protein